LHSAKARELLAFLACERGRAVSKRRAAEILWPDAGGDRALQRLYKTIQHIRKLTFRGQTIPLLDAHGEISLDLRRAEADTEEFLSLYASASPEDWKRALELYRGILLLDSDYDWAHEYETSYDVRYCELLERLAQHYAGAGNSYLARHYRDKLSKLSE
jgi:two-component SAPR family response regulator